MFGKYIRKFGALTLSIVIILGVLVPPVSVAAESGAEVSSMSFPAPVIKDNPVYSYEMSKPSVQINTPFDKSYGPAMSSTTVSGAPVVSGITIEAGPNDSVSLQGEGFAGGTIWVYGLDKEGNGLFTTPQITFMDNTTANAIIDKEYQYGMYMVWVESAAGALSRPIFVNKAKSDWLSQTVVSAGSTVYLYGKNLTTDNSDSENAVSYVYLTSGTKSYKAKVTNANPYKVVFTVPEGLADGTYKVWAHNGHGGDYGWTAPLNLTVKAGTENIWTGKTITVNPPVSTKIDATPILKAAIEAAGERGTVYLKNGTYNLKSTLDYNVAIRMMGESKEGVKIVVSIQDANGKFLTGKNGITVRQFPAEYRNLTMTDNIKDFPIDDVRCQLIELRGYDDRANGEDPEYLCLENCNFIKQRVRSSFQYTTTTPDPEVEAMLTERYTNEDGICYYSRYSDNTPAVDLEYVDGTYVRNCYFEAASGLSLRGNNDVIIENNEFCGTWVMYGNSGSAGVYIFRGQNIDISNNHFYGKDLITDPNGKLENYDLSICRPITLQIPTGSEENTYIGDNMIERAGDGRTNSGEIIMFESLSKFYAGAADAISSDGLTFTINNQPWEAIKDTFTKETVYRYKGTTYNSSPLNTLHLMILKGKGAGQYRKIVKATANTITVNKPWDIKPDETSIIVMAPAYVNSIIYRNTIIGPDYYDQTLNASAGVQAYATMLDYIGDRNNFSQLHHGFLCHMHYNTNGGNPNGTTDGFNFFLNTLIKDNEISDVRNGIDMYLVLAETDISGDDSLVVYTSLNTVIRNNNVYDCHFATNDYYNANGEYIDTMDGIGGVGVMVGTSVKQNNIPHYHKFHPGDWVKGTVIEHNRIRLVERGYIGAGHHQSATIIRNNYCEGKGDEEDIVAYEKTLTDYRSDMVGYPECEKVVLINNYGNEIEGIYGTVSNLQSFDEFKNSDFVEGLKYWASNSGNGYAADNASIVDGAVKVDSKIGITSVDFKPQNVPANSKVAVVYDWSGSENVRVELNGYGLQTVSRDKLNTFTNSDVANGWSRTINNYTLTTTEDLDLNVVIYSLDGTSAEIDNIQFVIVNEEAGYYETADGRKYNLLDGSAYGGNEDKGITPKNADDIYKYGYTEGLTNASFSEGLKFWQLSGTATSTISANGGKLVFSSAARYNGVISAPFKVFNSNFDGTNNRVAVMLDYTAITATGSYYSVNLYETVNGTTTKYPLTITAGVTTANTSGFSGAYSSTISWKENATYNLEILSNRANFGSEINEVRLARYDSSTLTYTDMLSGEIYKNNTTAKKLESVANISNNTVAEELKNGDFSNGNAYWYGTSTVTDGKLTPSTNVTSLPFKVNANAGDRIAVMFDYTATKSTSVTFKGATSITITISAGSGTKIMPTVSYDKNANYTITLSPNATYDNVRIVKSNGNGTYTDTVTGEIYGSNGAPYGGTYQDGFYSKGGYPENDMILSAPKNLDFSEGFRYWTTKCDRAGYASEDAVINADGSVKIMADANYDGITTAKFTLPNAKIGRQYTVYYDAKGEENINLRIYSSEGSWVGHGNSKNTNGVWKTISTSFTVTNVSAFYYFDFQLAAAGSEASLRNIRIHYLDEGGKGLYANFDGTPINYQYGDANADGRVDLADLVCVKKYLVDNSNKIYLAAANVDRDIDISVTATDISYIQNYVLTGVKEF